MAGLDSLTVPVLNLDTIYQITCPHENFIYPDKYYYTFPSFNPNNADEIAFVRTEYSFPPKFQLCKFNFCSGALKVLSDNALEEVDWSVKDWIVYEGADLQIWKVKSDGEGLTRLTNGGENSNPVWNKTGNKIAYWRTGAGGKVYVLDEFGSRLDTLSLFRPYAWSPNDQIICSGPGSDLISYTIGYFDLNNEAFIFFNEVDEQGYVFSMQWSPDYKEIYWVTGQKVSKFNMETRVRTNIIDIPLEQNSRFYEGIDISPDNKHIIVVKKGNKKVGNCDWEITYRLHILNIDGTNERELLVPE
jgi:WD40 repeat protein